MWESLFRFLRSCGLLRISYTIPLPSFCMGDDCMARQSSPSDFDENKAEGLPEVAVSRDFKHADPELVRRFLRVANDFTAQTGKSLLVTCTYRSPAEQNRLYKQGRFGNAGPIITQLDGKNKKSKHNYFPSKAIDVAVLDGGKATWDEKEYWPLLPLAKKHGLISGGEWNKFPDWPHLQLPEGVV